MIQLWSLITDNSDNVIAEQFSLYGKTERISQSIHGRPVRDTHDVVVRLDRDVERPPTLEGIRVE